MSTTITHRLSDAGDTVGHVLGDVSETVGSVLAEVGETVGHAIGDAWQASTSLAHDVVGAAADRVPGHRRRQSVWTVRRVLIAVGIAATVGLLVVAMRRGRRSETAKPPADTRPSPASSANGTSPAAERVGAAS